MRWPWQPKKSFAEKSRKALGSPITDTAGYFIRQDGDKTITTVKAENFVVMENPGAADVFGQPAASATISPVTIKETPPTEGKFTVDFHVKNIQAILETLASRRQSLVSTGETDREDFEQTQADLLRDFNEREADRCGQIAEIDRLSETYIGALKIAAPAENSDPEPKPIKPRSARRKLDQPVAE